MQASPTTQEIEERIPGVEDSIENIDTTVKENVKCKKTFNLKLSKKIRKDTSYWSNKNLPRRTLNSEHLCSKY